MHRLAKQIAQPGMKTEFLDAEQRLHARLVGVGVCGAVNPQPFAGYFQSVDDRDANASQFDSALEARGQGLNDASPKNGFGAGNP